VLVKNILFSLVLWGSCYAVIFAQSPPPKSLTLAGSLALAGENSPFLKVESHGVRIAEGEVTTARLRPNPVLNNQSLFSANSQFYPDNTHFGGKSNRQIWYQLTKPILSPALRQNRIALAQEGVTLAGEQFREIKRGVLYDVANQWLSTWSVGVHINLLKAAMSNIDSLLIINRLRLKNQFTTSTEVTRTQLLYDQYAIRLKTLEKDYQNQLKQLTFLVGNEVPVALMATDSSDWQDISQNIAFLTDEAYRLRPDLKATQQQHRMAEVNTNLQKAIAKPIPEVGLIYNPQNKAPYIGFYGTLPLPIFSRNQGEIQKAAVVKEQVKQAIVTAQTQINTEVQIAYDSYLTQKQNLTRWSAIIKQSEGVLNTIRYAYLRGGTTIVDFLEAQRTWYDTQIAYNDVLLEYRRSYVELLYSTGLILEKK